METKYSKSLKALKKQFSKMADAGRPSVWIFFSSSCFESFEIFGQCEPRSVYLYDKKKRYS